MKSDTVDQLVELKTRDPIWLEYSNCIVRGLVDMILSHLVDVRQYTHLALRDEACFFTMHYDWYMRAAQKVETTSWDVLLGLPSQTCKLQQLCNKVSIISIILIAQSQLGLHKSRTQNNCAVPFSEALMAMPTPTPNRYPILNAKRPDQNPLTIYTSYPRTSLPYKSTPPIITSAMGIPTSRSVTYRLRTMHR